MNKKVYIAILAALLLGFTVSASGQMTGTAYMINTGGFGSGGGSSASTAYTVTGLVPLAGTGISSGSNYTVVGGITGVAYIGTAALTATYDGTATMTVNMEARVLKVAYEGGTGTASGTVFYRAGGIAGFSSAAMIPGTGDTLIYNLPASALGQSGLEYYFTITRGTYTANEGSASSPLIFIVNMTNAQGQVAQPTPAGQYRMIGLPINITGTNTVSAVFTDDLGSADKSEWRLGSYNAATETVDEFPDAADVAPGQAYWLITRSNESYGAAGTSIRPNRIVTGISYYEVALDSGWNQLSNPYAFPIDWDDAIFGIGGVIVTDHPDTLLEDSLYVYDGGGYETQSGLRAWEGAFVKINKPNVSVLFRYRTAPPVIAKQPVATSPLVTSDHWSLRLTLKTDRYIDDGNFAGVRPDAESGPDRYDFSEPPPAPEAPRLAFRIPGDDSHLRRSDFRSTIDDGATWVIDISSAEETRVLTISDVDQIPLGMEAILVLDDGTKLELTDDTMLELSEQVHSARLIIGNGTYTRHEVASLLPENYELNQNFPNPFNPQTTIRYAIPKSGRVQLEVYNVLGQKVRSLVDAQMPAGYHEAVWNGTDHHSVPVASGVYFYRITTGTFNAYKKMLLVK